MTQRENHLMSREDRIATIELIIKWGLKYDGGKDVLKFIDRLEELADLYEVNVSNVIPVLPELLKDRALIWLRNNRKPWTQWPEFKRDFLGFFLPHRYFENLGDEIRKRTQRPRESFKDYVLALQDLMYHSHLNEEEKLEIIFHNSLPDYQWYIRRRDFKTLDELLSLVADMESIPTTTHPGRTEHHRRLKDKRCKQTTHLVWKEDKLKAVILLDQRLNTATVDTGATRSFMMPSIVNQMRPRPAYVSTDIEVALADGSRRRIYTAVKVPVTFGNITKTHEFLIVKEATEPVILGIDFLHAFNTTIYCSGLGANCEVKENGDIHSQVRTLIPVRYIKGPQFFCKISENELQPRIKKVLGKKLPKFQNIKGPPTAATHRILMKDDGPVKTRYEKRTARLSDLQQYPPKNKLSLLRQPWAPKQRKKRSGKGTNSGQQKFEWSRIKGKISAEWGSNNQIIIRVKRSLPPISHILTPPPRDFTTTATRCTIPTHSHMVAQLSLQVQQEIETRKQMYQGTRTRFTYIIHDQRYRITITRTSDVRVTQRR